MAASDDFARSVLDSYEGVLQSGPGFLLLPTSIRACFTVHPSNTIFCQTFRKFPGA